MEQTINQLLNKQKYSQTMHILTVRSTVPDNGPGTQSLVIAREMLKRGNSVSFATAGGVYVDTIRNAGFHINLIPELAQNKHNPFAITQAILKLRKVIQNENPDVIHGHNAAASICAAIASYLLGKKIPIVTSVRGVEERENYQWRNKIWKLTPGLLLGVADKTRQRLLSFNVPEKKIRVTYNGVELERFCLEKVDREAERKKLGLTDKIVVGTTGAITGPEALSGPSKGQHNLVKAVGLLKDKHPNLAILLVGDGPKRWQVEEAAKTVGIENRVIFAGRRFDIPEMLSAMDIYCLASIYGEFFPNSIIEAMAMGLPWIGSDIAGLSELTANNQAGWVSPIDDVEALAANLDKLASHPELRHQRGACAISEVHNLFTIEKVCDRIISAYKDVGLKLDV